MTNGENTAFIPIRDFLTSRGIAAYTGYQSDSEVFAHILHYSLEELGLGIDAYKHVITPLQKSDLSIHPNAEFLTHLKRTCRALIIDGPTVSSEHCRTIPVHGPGPEKLRPGVVGGKPGLYGFSSEICGLDAVIPDRDKTRDIQPMHLDTAIVGPDRQEVTLCRQPKP